MAVPCMPTKKREPLPVSNNNLDISQKPDPVSFMEAFIYWLRLGFISFGGPAGQISMMHQEVVKKRRWISEHRFLYAPNYTICISADCKRLANTIKYRHVSFQ